MKLRFFTFIILFFSVIGISAQEISVKSFRLLPEDLTARVNPVKNDNAQTCALVRIVTTERGFEFDPDALGMCKSVDETHAGEVWIWLAPGSRRLTIRHSALGVLRNYEYPVAIESACTYEMVLVTGRITTIVEEQNKANFVAITFLPQNAQLKIDNAPVATRDGSYAHTLPVGKHTYELLCPMYHTLSGEFQILPDSTTSINVALQPNFGQLVVYSEPESGADVFINGEKKGVTPYTSSQLQSGFCQVQVVKNMFQPAEQQVEIRDGDTAVVRLTMQPNFGESELVCADSVTEIWIDGVRFGAGRWSGRLEAGIHLVELRKPSHHVVSQSIEVKNGERRSISLPPPTPIYGQVSVNVLPLGADILLDGKIVGQTPRMLDHILIGEHEIKLQKAGCTSVTRTIMVKEGETAEVTAELATGRQVMLKSDPAGASLYIDGSYAGTAPYSVALSFGTHTVKAVNDGVTKQETITVSENGQSEWTLNVQKDGQSCGTVKDYDGNTYATVQIGDQCWMKENLRTTHYADGNSILYGTTTSRGTTIPQDGTTSYNVGYWYYPDNNSSNKATYGLLYNWKAVMSKSSSSKSNPSGVQGICPKGWHVPSDAEWTQLTNYVSSQNRYCYGGNTKEIAKALASTTGWVTSREPCDVGNDPSSNNATGFSAIPAGCYPRRDFGYNAYFWSATEVDGSCTYYRNLRYDQADIYRKDYNKYFGLSVRCVRDSDTGSLKAVNDGVGKAQHKPLTQKAHVAESEVSATDREQPTEEANDTIRGAAKLKQRAPMGIFFTLNAACSTSPQWSGGLRVGTTRKWGWNVSLMTNFNMKAAKAELPEAGTQYAFAAKKSSRLSATAGPVWHPDPHVLLFLNVGYGYRGVCYQALADGEFYRYQNGTLQGAECSLGVMLNIKGLLLSIEATTINFKYGEFKFGLGGIIYKR